MHNSQQSAPIEKGPARRDFSETEFEPLSLEEILAIYKRWYKLSLATFFGIFTLAAIVIFLILPLYQAKGTVWINRLNPQSQYAVQREAMAGGTTFRNLDRQEEIATYAEMVKARPIAEATVEKLSLTREKLNHIRDFRRYVRAIINGVIEGISYIYSETKYFLRLSTRMSPEMEAALNHVRLVDEVIKRIDVTPVMESNILEISFKSSDPVLAKDVVNALLDEFLSFSGEIREERAKSFFSSSANALRESLESAEMELLELQKQYSSYSIDHQRRVLVTKYAEAQDRLRDIQINKSALEARIEAYRQRLQEKPQKRHVIGEANPLVHQDLKLKLVNSEIELVSATTAAEAGKEMLKKYVAELEALGKADLLIKAQERKINQLEEAYQINLRNLDGASAIQAMSLASLSAVRIVSHAPYPLKPVRPRKLYYLLIALGGAILAALAMPFMAYLNDKSIADADDIKKYLGLDFVMVFPNLKSSLKGKA